MRYWLDTGLSVASDDLLCPGKGVCNTNALRLAKRHPEFKVFWSVVSLVAVDVVDVLTRKKRATKLLLHHEAMFIDPPPSLITDTPIAVGGDVLAFERANTPAFARSATPRSSHRVTPASGTLVVNGAVPLAPNPQRAACYGTDGAVRCVGCEPVGITAPAEATLLVGDRARAVRRGADHHERMILPSCAIF